jgi:hypothetical protein
LRSPETGRRKSPVSRIHVAQRPHAPRLNGGKARKSGPIRQTLGHFGSHGARQDSNLQPSGYEASHCSACTLAKTALPLLEERRKELRHAEEQRKWQLAHDAARAERDALTKELAEVYPPMVDKLVDLLRRLAANDRALHIVNKINRPAHAEFLRSAEEIARGIMRGNDNASIVRDLKLPAFKHERVSGMFAWPDSSTPAIPVTVLSMEQKTG